MVRTAFDPDIPFVVAPGTATYSARLADSVVDLIRRGVLNPGQRLPSTRLLSARLRVTRGTVVAAYDELAAAGYIQSTRGAGTVVAPGAAAAAAAGAATRTTWDERTPTHGWGSSAEPAVRWDLSPGRPDTSLIDRRAWRRAWRLAADEPIRRAPSGPDGHRELRQALAHHLRRSRGLVASAEDIFVVPGVTAALRALVGALRLRGEVTAVEDPGYDAARDLLVDAGTDLAAVPADGDGLIVDALPEQARLVYVTPAHQYPLGGRLPVGRRAALLEWSRRTGALVVEDDYDGEFRYDVPPLPALATLDRAREVVAYVGTFSKTLAPELRVAWLLPPSQLRAGVRASLDRSGEEVPRMVSAALTRLLTEGAIAAHLVRVRRRYAHRRTAFVSAMRRWCPQVPILGVEAGLHVVVRLPDGVDDDAFSTALLRAGVKAPSLAAYRVDPRHGPRGLVCGYAGLPESAAGDVARTFARLLDLSEFDQCSPASSSAGGLTLIDRIPAGEPTPRSRR